MRIAPCVLAATTSVALLALCVRPVAARNTTTAIASARRAPEPPAVEASSVSVLPALWALAPDLLRAATPAKNLALSVWAKKRALRVLALVTHAPVDGELSSPFGARRDPLTRRRRRHKGIDFDADRGDRVVAAGSGRVVLARRKGSYGRLVIIDHGFGVQTRYAHLRRIAVRAGELVAAGEVIGKVGASGRATGPHLHFEIRVGGEAIDPGILLQRIGLPFSQR